MKFQRTFLTLTFTFAGIATAEAARWVPITCYLSLPRLSRSQSEGPYEAWGADATEAKQRTLKLCTADLEVSHPGACKKYAAESDRTWCTIRPRFEF